MNRFINPYADAMGKFFGNSPKAITCWSILAAVSAAGSLVSVIYTYSRGT